MRSRYDITWKCLRYSKHIISSNTIAIFCRPRMTFWPLNTLSTNIFDWLGLSRWPSTQGLKPTKSIKVRQATWPRKRQLMKNSKSNPRLDRTNCHNQNKKSQRYELMMSYLHTFLSEANELPLKGEQKVESYRREFEEISKLIKSELDRFDKEKVEDFKAGVESFLESIIENQKQVIDLTIFPRPSVRFAQLSSFSPSPLHYIDNCIVGVLFWANCRLWRTRTRAWNGLSVYSNFHSWHLVYNKTSKQSRAEQSIAKQSKAKQYFLSEHRIISVRLSIGEQCVTDGADRLLKLGFWFNHQQNE